MKSYKEQIQKYKCELTKKYVRDEAENETVNACQDILRNFVLTQQPQRASYFEFLYEQSKFIQKRWWFFQGILLTYLWFWFHNNGTDFKGMIRLLGIFATIFVVLIVPEIWKNKRNGAIEVEKAAYYTLRQICSARMLLFAVVDFIIVMVFLVMAYQTTILSLNDLMINFLLPVNVSCCICFRLLYSRLEKSEYVAVLFCLMWVAVWMMIVANDGLYQRITVPVWYAVLLLSAAYFIFCVRKSLIWNEKILEEHTYGIRI